MLYEAHDLTRWTQSRPGRVFRASPPGEPPGDSLGEPQLCASASLRLFQYDLDGNLTSDGVFTCAYDSKNRLTSVSSNNIPVASFAYDARSRRVRKVTAEAATTFFYDDWNLIEERIAYTNGTTSTIRYYWGNDLSGTLQGAGGIGGLLYIAADGIESSVSRKIPLWAFGFLY
jgi:YD repeat-containing protein